MTTPAVAPPPPGPAEWQLWFDGSAQPNPGRLGLGAVLVGPGGERRDCSVLAPGHGCNNEAELLALIAALQLAQQLDARCLTIRTDSQVLLEQLGPPLAKPARPIARLQALFDSARLQMQSFDELVLQWVPRHRNTEADALARAAHSDANA